MAGHPHLYGFRALWPLLVVVPIGCVRSHEPPVAPAPPAPAVSSGGGPSSSEGAAAGITSARGPGAPAAPATDPQALYRGCHDRVEGPEQDGECATDADCVRAGCSREVCLPRKEAEGLMTTCEILPCFSVLDTCGCHAGRCTWTVSADAGRPGRMHHLPIE